MQQLALPAQAPALNGEILPPPFRPMSGCAKQAMRARAQALIDDFEEAGAFLSLTSTRPNTIWVGVPLPPLFGRSCDYARVDRLKRRLHQRRTLYPHVLAILHERYDPLFEKAKRADAARRVARSLPLQAAE